MSAAVWGKAWDHKLRVADVFHNEAMTFEERRDSIVHRIKASSWYKAADEASDFSLTDPVEGLTYAEDGDEFDASWDEFYDWCDDGKRVWIETR